MGTWRILNKVESQTIANGAKWTIPSNGLSTYTQYELSILVNGSGNHPAELVHQSSTSTGYTGYHIEAGSVMKVGPVEVADFPAIRASHGEIDAHVSYAIIPQDI